MRGSVNIRTQSKEPPLQFNLLQLMSARDQIVVLCYSFIFLLCSHNTSYSYKLHICGDTLVKKGQLFPVKGNIFLLHTTCSASKTCYVKVRFVL